MHWKNRWIGLTLGASLLLGQNFVYSAEAVNFLLPGEALLGQAAGDVTGDTVEDNVYLVGRLKDGIVSSVNLVMENGATGEFERTAFTDVTGYAAKLFIGDFNGDQINDAMAALQMESKGIQCVMVAFNQPSPQMIFSSIKMSADEEAVRSGEIVLTEADTGSEIKVKVGSQIQLRLPENPSTGYTWQLNGLDNRYIEFAGQQNFVPDGTPTMAGSPALKVITFNAKQIGTVTLDLANYRIWEGVASAMDKFKVTLTIVE